MNKTTPQTWGKSDQKIILIHNDDFSELQAHLNNDEWRIESISACGDSACYVLLEHN